MIEDAVQQSSVGAAVTLFALDATALGGEVYRFTPMSDGAGGAVTFDGTVYVPAPVIAEGFESNGRGALPTPTLRVANVNGLFSAAAIEFNDLKGATLTRIRTFANFLDGAVDADPAAVLPSDVWRIERKSAQTKVYVEWELAALIDQGGVYLPRRQVLQNACALRYRRWNATLGAFAYDASSMACPYTGGQFFDRNGNLVADPAQDLCSKKLNSGCALRFGSAPLPFGGFPGVDRVRLS